MSLASSLDLLPEPPLTPAERMRSAFMLFEAGVEMKRLSLKRQHPELNQAELEAHLMAWLQQADEP